MPSSRKIFIEGNEVLSIPRDYRLKVKFKKEILEKVLDTPYFTFEDIDGDENKTISYNACYLIEPYFIVTEAEGYNWCYRVMWPSNLGLGYMAKSHVEPYQEFNITIEDDVWEL